MINALPPPGPAEYALIGEARAVHDTATLRPADYRVDNVAAWVVAEDQPAPGSGSATTPGSYIDGDTGQVVTPPDAHAVVVKKGQWRAIAVASPNQPKSGGYAWSEPLADRRRSLTPEDYYSPFAYGGTIIFRPGEAAGAAQFGAVHMLFPEWAGQVKPAFEAWTKLAMAPVGQPAAAADPSALGRLLSEANDLLAVMTFRNMIERHSITPARATQVLNSAGLQRRAVLVDVMLTASAADASSADWSDGVIAAINASTDTAAIEATALGAFAAAIFQSGGTALATKTRAVLAAARSHLHAIGKPPTPGSRVATIFEKSGL